jgi:hypothetical protein
MKKLGIGIIETNRDYKITVESIKKNKLENSKVTLVKSQNSKPEIHNKIIETFSDYEFICFVKAGEEFREDYFKILLSVFDKYRECMVSYSNFKYENYAKILPSFDRRKIINGEQIPTTAIFKTKVFEECGNFDPSIEILYSWDFWLRITEKFPMFHIPEIMYSSFEDEEEYDYRKMLNEKNYILEKIEERKNGK